MMEPKIKIIKKSSPRQKYRPEKLEEALQAVQGGMKVSTAAYQHNVPRSTLHSRIAAIASEAPKMGPKLALTEAEENRISEWILGRTKVGFAICAEEIKDVVQLMVQGAPRENIFVNDRPGDRWINLYLGRHPEMKEHIHIPSRTKHFTTTEEKVRQWFTEVRTFLKENNALNILDRPQSIFSGDHTGVEIPLATGNVCPKNENNVYEITKDKEKKCITLHYTFSAAGESIQPFIVFPYQKAPEHFVPSVPDGWQIRYSKNGWISHDNFHDYVANTFYPWCVKSNVQFPVLYFLDGHKYPNISPNLQDFCSQHKIILYALPYYSTNIMEPCNIAIFQPSQAHYQEASAKYEHQTGKKVSIFYYPPLMKGAIDRLRIKAETIQMAFRACGLYPFDEDAIDYTRINYWKNPKTYEEPKSSSVEKEDFATAKKVIEHIIGPEQTKLYIDRRDKNGTEDPIDRVFRLWSICADNVEGLHMSKDIEITPNTSLEVPSTNESGDVTLP